MSDSAPLLQEGQRLPVFVLTDADGRAYPLAQTLSQQGVVMYFMRTASCPACRSHVRSLDKKAAEFARRGYRLLAVVPESAVDAAAVQRELRVSIPVVASEGAHAAVGLSRRFFGTLQESGTVAIARGGTVKYIRRATLPTSALDEAELWGRLDKP